MRANFLVIVFCGLSQITKSLRIDIKNVNLDKNSTSEEIRCYCNLSDCIATSYMCKSRGLGCFSDIVAFSDVNRAKHGCLDLLERERQDQCQNEPSAKVSHPRSLLLCCHQDLCNHVDRPDSFLASSLVNASEQGYNKISTYRSSAGYTNAEVWFRAATIAVPICGILILFVLIALAVKILRSDMMDDRVLAAKLRAKQSVFSHNLVHQYLPPNEINVNGNAAHKKPLLFQHNDNNFSRPHHGQGVNMLHSCTQKEKNEANAKLNFSQHSDTVPIVPLLIEAQPNLIDLHKPSNPASNNCNLFQQEQTCALLSTVPMSVSKLNYKKPLVINWTDRDLSPNNSK